MKDKYLAVGLPLIVLVVGILGAVALVKAKKPVESTTPPVPVRTVTVATVKLENHNFTVETHGVVQPRTETTLMAEVTGRITRTHDAFITGGFVSKGDVLLEIDPAQYRAGVASAEAALARAEAQLKREEAEADVARKEWESFGEGEPSTLVLREPQVAEARASVASAQATLDKTQLDLERTRIRAPFDGRLRQRYVDQGQFVTAGTRLAMTYGTDVAEVRLPIAPEEVAFLDLPLGGAVTGDEAATSVTLEVDIGGETHAWDALITHTEGEVDPQTRMLHAVARVQDPYRRQAGADRDDAPPPLLVGMFVRARITGRNGQDIALIPRHALRNGSEVLVVDESDRLRSRSVEILRLGDGNVVIGGGLKPGERVCTTDIDDFVEGMSVRVAAPPARAEEG